METSPPPPPPPSQQPETGGEYSNFFSDVKAFWDYIGTPLIATVAIIALAWGGYNFFTQRAENARQLAWIDLYASTSPESLELLADSVNNPAVRAVARLRAGDLLLTESKTADADDAEAILTTARGHYAAVLDGSEHTLYQLNALDGLAVVAESLGEFDLARQRYEDLTQRAEGEFPYWVSVAERRLALLPTLNEPVVFAPESEPEPAAAESDNEPAADTPPAETETAETAADPAPAE
jgi:hypothetical protein